MAKLIMTLYNNIMSLRKINLVQDQYYHVYNRGNSKQKIFLDDEDYYRFVKLLYVCNSENKFIFRDSITKKKMDVWDFDKGNNLVDIGSYCLMPNHFHILITGHRKVLWQKKDSQITIYMKKILTAYAMYFNKKYKRTGSLFEGKFKSEHVDDDRYLKYLFSYIHLNPIKIIQKDWKEKGIKDKKHALEFLNNYKYSSYIDFLGESRLENKILNIKSFPNYFPSKEKFKKDILGWLKYGN